MAGHASGDQGVGVPRAAIGPPRFIGRDGELDALRSALTSGTAVVLIEGEAGIGKSRLLAEFLDTTQILETMQTGTTQTGTTQTGGASSRTLVAVCPPFRRPHTLGALVDALRQSTDKVGGLGLSPLAGALRPLFPEWAAELPAAPEPVEDATAVRHRLFGALCELLDRTGVAVLAVEDAHCADEATLEFLLFLCARRTRRISVIVTYRPEDLPEDSAVRRLSSLSAPSTTRLRVALGPLDVAATAGLVSSMLAGAQVSPEFAQFLHQRTDGVPLAVEESVRLMGDRADLARRDGAWVRREIEDIDVPATIRDAVLERFHRTSPATRTLLEAAAVLTDPSAVGLILAVSALGEEDAQAALDEAVGTRLLTEGRRDLLAFGHVLAGRAVYESIPAARRRTMHRRAGIALRDVSPPPLAQLARHFRAAGDTQDWSTYAEQAADLALASGDDATAAGLLGELITEVRLPGATVVRLARKVRLTAPEDSDRIRDLIRSLRAVLAEQHLDDRGEAEVRAELGRLELLVENIAAGRKELQRAVPHLSHDPVAAAQAMIVLGWAIGEPLPNETYLYWLRRAAEMIALPMPEKDRNRLRVNRAVGLLTLGEQEGWAEVERIQWDAPHTAEHLGIANNHYNLGVMALQWGHYDLARRHLASARELAERHPYQRHLTLALAAEAGLDWATGRWDGLAERLHGIVEAAAGAATSHLEVRLTSHLLAAARGDRLTAEQGLSEVLAGSGEAPGCALAAAAALAAMALADGDVDRALMLTQEPLDLVTGNGMWLSAVDLVPVRIEALTAAGGARDIEARHLVRGFSEWLHGRDVPVARAALTWCRALLAQSRSEHERAAALCARAALLWDALPRPYAASAARERQAACLSAGDRRESALPLLEQVLAEYRELGADADVVRVAATLRAHGVDAARPRPARRGYGDRLSPRELEVAGLVIGGRTNRDIGEVLYLSPRTVARHLDSAMRKLGVSSRTALAVRLVELGLGPAS
ncbi:ATP-binding protein [Catenulispora pinisilvae]|uniref:ATP-binding protein n=1 Tax=Catenulispora pinisilvae TaxID=2705253 RepID=UPI001891E52E|nr:LuxR family transcriptional regulator [Catenulispora pinisilvae]